jgi:hypothetical protein
VIYDFIKELKPEEIEAIKKNAEHWDSKRRLCPMRCGNPYCQWPLPLMSNFRLLEYGDVCGLCYELFHIFSESAYWNRVQLDEKPKKPKDDGRIGLL